MSMDEYTAVSWTAEDFRTVARAVEAIVPGTWDVGPAAYVDNVASGMTLERRSAIVDAARTVVKCIDSGFSAMEAKEAFDLIRAWAIEAYYSDFRLPGSNEPSAWESIGFVEAPMAQMARQDWSHLPLASKGTAEATHVSLGGVKTRAPSACYDAVIIGSGAGGGVVASRLAEQHKRVLLVERGGYHLAGSYSRWELRANAQLWNPPVFARTNAAGPIVMVSGKGVGGSTNINTKVGIRPIEQDYRKWFDATGLRGSSGAPFGPADLDPWLMRVEQQMLVRARADWSNSVRVVQQGFVAQGASLTPVMSYTTTDCESCGSCTAGCPTNAGSTTLNRYIHPQYVRGALDVAAETEAMEILTTNGSEKAREATGVRLRDASGEYIVETPIVVVAGGALHTPRLLQLSELDRLGTQSSTLIGNTLGLHTARMVQGDFDQIMDAHIVYPITAHCEDFARDEDGGFVIEATTLLDPMALAHNLVDDAHRPLHGAALVKAMQRYRHLAGLFMMTNDSNRGRVSVDDAGELNVSVEITAEDHQRLDAALDMCRRVLTSAGARRIIPTGYLTSHIQGSVRMGSDPARSACDENQQLWDVQGVYVGDSSVIPRTLTYNPSLTIMALAERLADHLTSRMV